MKSLSKALATTRTIATCALPLVIALTFVGQANALSNTEGCATKVKNMALQIRNLSGGLIRNATVKGIDFKGDLSGIQQLDGIHEVTFDNDAKAEIRLDLHCGVLEYRVK